MPGACDECPSEPRPLLRQLLEWLPPEELDGGMVARGVLWRGKPIGMLVHLPLRSPPRTLVQGPLGDAFGEPADWLDGLGEGAAMDAVEANLQDILAEEVEAAMARRLAPPLRPPAREETWTAGRPPLESTA